MSFAFVVSFVIVGLGNEIGAYYDFWSYPHQFLIFTHRFNAVDFAVVPVIFALTYQYFSMWKPYLVATVINSAIMCFVGILIFVYFGLYKLENLKWTPLSRHGFLKVKVYSSFNHVLMGALECS
ncbi:hypothetical protein [Bacillus sp. EB600]|uniref:hypothetical protein n=1 Tax=Bacillus sp. EB600 TaxID=2806345 RepID=UPI00210D2913|nr:hypothetical protein [Bacillus sp. EB600]MCQ6282965.1 hypothetical protein [Bacillus sp. EB600]